MYFTGIDIGSTSAKTIVLGEDGQILYKSVQPTGWSSVDTAETIRQTLLEQGFDAENGPCTATGYGRISVPYANKTVTEITCHAKGAVHLFDQEDMLVIDIGGQDTKIIRIERGQVRDFMMNDKCSAGTGRFLEVMANSMSMRPDQMCEIAEEGSGSGVSISSMCTVFAESEVIGLIGKGEKRENIAYAVVDSIISRVAGQCSRLFSPDVPVFLTGGLCECDYIRRDLGQRLGSLIRSCPDARYAGAIGAALTAMRIR